MSDPASPEPASPLVSVVIRSMDRASLGRALESVAQQAVPGVEVVLVNALGPLHGPTPPAAGAHALRRVDAGRALPRSVAANAGLDAARGRYLIYLDDDDVYLADHLSRLLAALQAAPDALAAYADVDYGRDGDGGSWLSEHVFAADWDPLRLRFENFLPLHAVLVDREAALRHGCRFDEQLELFEDWDWWLQLSRHGRFVRVPGVSARYIAASGPGSGVFVDDARSAAARERLQRKWAGRDRPEDQLALLRALQSEFRAARQAQDQLALARTTEHNLRTMLDARQQEIDNLKVTAEARQAEVDNGIEHAASLQRVLDARDAELDRLRPATSATPVASSGHTLVFTIVSRNYLHFALNLMASVERHLPGTQRVIVLCDAREQLPELPAGIELLGIDELGIAALDRMVVQYTILELNTAIKPFVFGTLFERPEAERVIYFDPDIQLYGSGEPLLRRLEQTDVVLTPHLTAPLDDDRHPSDLSILQSGSYNLGFLALRRSGDTQALVRWWQRKLERDCVVDIPRGLFTDQKWMDLVPSLCSRVLVERDPGWNVAYWNLAHRQVEGDERHGWRVNGRPLFFFHFSGYTPGSRSISKHQDRFTLGDLPSAAQQLFHGYDQSVAAAGRERFAKLPYAFAALADGTVLPDCGRQLLREQLDWTRPLPDLRSAEGARFVVDFLTAPVDDRQPALSRLALQLYRQRGDLQAAFPDVQGAHRQAFLDWFRSQAPKEAKVPPALIGPESPAPAPAAAAAPPAAPPLVPRGSGAYRLAYQLAWNSRNLLRPLTTPQTRQRVRSWLVQRAWPAQPAAAAAPAAALPWGLTLIGYLHAESGVGESARATLRALAHAGVPHAVHDFRDGNVSRMGERIDPTLPTGTRHAVSLFHVNADQMPHARAALGDTWFGVPHRIGFWAWELEHFPEDWQGAFDHVDEVWVPSSFCQRAVAERSPVPVLVVPHAIAIPDAVTPDRAAFGLDPQAVVFLAMADVMSSPERKNPFGAVEAFVRAFGAQAAGVQLVVKVSNGDRDPAAMARLRTLAEGCPAIRLIDGYLDRDALNRLIDSADVFVSLHRAEGFGLVNAEAMARGKVVVATAWSGNTDFMNAANSLPVDYRLQPIGRDIGPYRADQRWAEPDLEHAAEQMRRVVAEPGLRRRLGERARADCIAQLSPPVVGRRVGERLAAIRRRKGL